MAFSIWEACAAFVRGVPYRRTLYNRLSKILLKPQSNGGAATPGHGGGVADSLRWASQVILYIELVLRSRVRHHSCPLAEWRTQSYAHEPDAPARSRPGALGSCGTS